MLYRWKPELGGEGGGYRFTIPLGRWSLLIMIIPPIAIALFAMFGSGSEYMIYGGPALLSGFLVYPIMRWARRRF